MCWMLLFYCNPTIDLRILCHGLATTKPIWISCCCHDTCIDDMNVDALLLSCIGCGCFLLGYNWVIGTQQLHASMDDWIWLGHS